MGKLTAMILLLAPHAAMADYNLNGKIIDCYCTDSKGGRVEIGDMICLQVDGRMFTAQCQMSLNVPMWREISNGCLSSKLREPSGNAPGIDPEIAPSES